MTRRRKAKRYADLALKMKPCHGVPKILQQVWRVPFVTGLESIRKDSDGTFEFQESMAIQQLVWIKAAAPRLLTNINIGHQTK